MNAQKRIEKLEHGGKGHVLVIAESMTTEQVKRAGFPYFIGNDAHIPPGAVVIGLSEQEMKVL